jgi:hypothetical protein
MTPYFTIAGALGLLYNPVVLMFCSCKIVISPLVYLKPIVTVIVVAVHVACVGVQVVIDIGAPCLFSI